MWSRQELTRMWDDNGKAIAATLGLVAPGLLAAGVEWQSMGGLPFIERCMCAFGYFSVVSVLWLIAINAILNKLTNKKGKDK